MARRRPGRWPPRGIRQQVPQTRWATARCCRSCTSTATRSANPAVLARIGREELEQLLPRLRLDRRIFVESASDPVADAPGDGRGAWMQAVAQIRPDPARRARTRRHHRAAALADDRAAIRPRAGPALTMRGWTCPTPKAPSARTRCPSWSVSPDQPAGAPGATGGVVAQLQARRSCSTPHGRFLHRTGPRWHRIGASAA